jgi:hypothetical protein
LKEGVEEIDCVRKGDPENWTLSIGMGVDPENFLVNPNDAHIAEGIRGPNSGIRQTGNT